LKERKGKGMEGMGREEKKGREGRKEGEERKGERKGMEKEKEKGKERGKEKEKEKGKDQLGMDWWQTKVSTLDLSQPKQ
jgi:hypothetical protein